MRDIYFRLKKLAQDLDIPIVVFASLPGEGGVTQTEIVDNADVVMTLQEPDHKDGEGDIRGKVIEVQTKKEASPKTVRVLWKPGVHKFKDVCDSEK